MNALGKIMSFFKKLKEAVARVNYGPVVKVVGTVMHKIVLEWFMPKHYRSLSKKEIFEIIFKSDTPAGKKFDVWLLALIVANIVLLMFDSVWGATDTMTSGVHESLSFWVVKALEWAFTLLFTFEYYLRIYCLKHPMKYVLSFWGVIDFLSIFPAYLSIFVPTTQALTVLRLLRVLRIFRIFKMKRFQMEAFHLMNALRNSAIKILIFMMVVMVAAVILGTLMYAFEAEVNPTFKSIPTGIYWAVVTITTVGFGDVVPITTPGRFLAVIVMLLGYSIIAVPTGIVAGETLKEYRFGNRRRSDKGQIDYDDENEAIKS